MKPFVLVLFLGICVSACSSIKGKSPKSRSSSSGTPKWVNNPIEFCGERKLCAVGEATGRMRAEAEARKAISSIFRTQIKSKTQVTTTSESTSQEGVVEGSANEDFYSQVEALTDDVLEGVEIREYYEDSEAVFALASLDKRKASKMLKTKIDEVETDIFNFYKDGRRGSLNKALKKFSIRRELYERFQFLSERTLSPRVSRAQILKKKRAKRALGTKVKLNVEEIGSSGELKQAVLAELVNNDYFVVAKKGSGHEYVLKSKLSAEKEFFNVKGWEKYKFILSFNALKQSGEKLGSLNKTFVQTGRDFTQAYERVMPTIKSFITQNFDELNID
ncbi:MAG: LPP20 family lipoprotein [Bacteriovoracaceae bacterium]